VSTATASYKGHRYPVEIINHCVWLYFRFPLSFREVEELMLVRGVVVSYETIRRWCAKFGQAYANQLRRRRPRPGDKWHLDEVFVKINGITGYLWRAVDQHGNVLDVLVQSRRNAKAAKRFFRKLLNGPAVCAARAGDRQTGQLRGCSPPAHVVGGPPAVTVSQQSRRELSSAHPTTRTGDETL
jgi:putative transposase